MRARRTRVAVVAAALFALAAGIAYAAIPSADGTYHACVQQGSGLVHVIDPATQACDAEHQTAIAFGAQGAAGISPTVAQLAAGDAHCPAGGAAITDASGSIAYVCSGSDGRSFDGTFASPNGQYAIAVADDGVSITGPGGTHITLTGTGISIQSSTAVDVRAGTSLSLRGDTTATLRAAGAATVQAGGTLTLLGATISMN